MSYEIINSDCLKAMQKMPDGSIDAIVTDPPYGLAFMGVAWDTFNDGRKGGSRTNATFDQVGGNHHPTCAADQARTRKSENKKFQERMTPIFAEALRVAKPGAHLLCFGGTRTFHRMACAIEDAGWEIRDTIMWVTGQGFPKSMDVSKAIEKKHGADAAAQWDGWGTCLKPAWEPIIVARKPLDGTVAHNVMEYGTGAINIDGCRVGTETMVNRPAGNKAGGNSLNMSKYGMPQDAEPTTATGRFPANLVHDGSQEVLELFPDSKGQQGKVAGNEPSRTGDNGIYVHYGQRNEFVPRGDSGSAARFFYCAKASKKDRGEGNDHPTVKPNALMRWLVRLVCPQGGTVLDPFMGSGSTGVACIQEGMRFVGIDMDEHYCEIAEKRIGAEPDTVFAGALLASM